jgi:hypothetical protein
MIEVSGEGRIGEGQARALWLISKRVTGFGPGAFVAVLLILYGAGFGTWAVADALFPSPFSDWNWLLGVAVGVLVAIGFRRWQQRHMVRAWMARGETNPVPVVFRVADDAFVYTAPAFEFRYRWEGISEIAPSKTFWLYISGRTGLTLPRRLFADATAERAFLAASLDRMNEAACARSAEAVAYAAQGAKG